ncbi:MAG: type II toxin-antitoxin system VapC family toxin [Verrucomicrobiales bacterium]
MILLDSNVLIDAFDSTAPAHGWAVGLVRDGLLGNGVAINPVILAELCVGDRYPDTVASRLDTLGVRFLDLPAGTALRCAQAYAAYLENRRHQPAPPPPKTPLPDFFIGAHASTLGLPLATADVSRYQIYFPEVELRTPSGGGVD